MAYWRAVDIVELALELQGTWQGLRLIDIERRFEISRRTAQRLLEAVENAFGAPYGELEVVANPGERVRRWRLRSRRLRSLITVSAAELAELTAAAAALERNGLEERAVMLRQLDDKLRALLETEALPEIEPDLQALMVAEGVAMRPGPRPRLDEGLLALLRDAIKSREVVAFDYLAQATGERTRRRVRPYGVIYGNRAFLVGHTERGRGMRLWRLANVSGAGATGDRFERDPAFDLQQFAKRSFGTYQEDATPEVAIHFAAQVAQDVNHFVFHPDQTVTENGDGSLTVRFAACGLDEICWHLVTWGTHATIEQPAHLRQRMQTMCRTLAAHHGGGAGA